MASRWTGAAPLYVTDTGNNTIRERICPHRPTEPSRSPPARRRSNVATGRTAVFNATAIGTPTPTYQWTLNGSTTIPGAAATNDPHPGDYRCDGGRRGHAHLHRLQLRGYDHNLGHPGSHDDDHPGAISTNLLGARRRGQRGGQCIDWRLCDLRQRLEATAAPRHGPRPAARNTYFFGLADAI